MSYSLYVGIVKAVAGNMWHFHGTIYCWEIDFFAVRRIVLISPSLFQLPPIELFPPGELFTLLDISGSRRKQRRQKHSPRSVLLSIVIFSIVVIIVKFILSVLSSTPTSTSRTSWTSSSLSSTCQGDGSVHHLLAPLLCHKHSRRNLPGMYF